MDHIFDTITWQDFVAAIIAIILTIIIGVIGIKGDNPPTEVVAFLTLVTGYLFRATQTPVANGVKAIVSNGAPKV
jgi:hypothetical protein